MQNPVSNNVTFASFIRSKFPVIRDNSRLITQFVFATLVISLGTWFLRHQHSELIQIKRVLLNAHANYVLIGIGVTVTYILLQGFMYKMAFASVRKKVPLYLTTLLYLKRNLISIFMPAGGVTSLAFFSDDIEKTGITKSKVLFASSIYAFIGFLSIILVAVPVFIYSMAKGVTGVGELLALAGMIAIVSFFYVLFRSIVRKRFLYRIIIRFFPFAEVLLDDLASHVINIKYLISTILVSVLIDISGIVLLYIAMLTLGVDASVFYALLGYLVGVISLSVSPFMRGLGAVELSMAFILTKLGYSSVDAVAVTFMYRFFEFWLPLVASALSFLLKFNRLLMRVLPAFLIFALGVINIFSAITPAISYRMHLLEDFLPLYAISASNFFVFIAGAFLMLTAVFLLKGQRNAWWIAIVLTILSCIAHITKAIDFEEATVALIVTIILVLSKKEYNMKGNPKLHYLGIRTALFSVLAVVVYGTVGFTFIDRREPGLDLTLWQSISYTLKNFILLGGPDLFPVSRFAREFIVSINISGVLSLGFLFYTIIRPYIFKKESDPAELINAKELATRYGTSGLDYFKTYFDKLIFAPRGLNAFISYRIAANFAVILEDPVAENVEAMKQCITMFDRFCYDNGLRNIHYRVPEESLEIYKQLSKRSMFVGQEGIVDLNTFTLEGGKNKALRNAINKIIEQGYKSSVHTPPIRDGLIQRLKAVSDEWLRSTGREEIIFSQGMFVWDELKNQTILTVENSEEKVIAFLNIIPDFATGEGTYDLIRKTDDAPHGVLDFILIELFRYLKAMNYSKVNLGFAPMSGIDDPHNFQERSLKFAYEKIRSFSHYKGLRNYKEKFNPVWYNKYLIYSNDYDLLQVPSVLAKVIKP
ncbi:MAG: phosphatidylglycerol lysyltransferase domain-containing protein [Bacteroidales bacterium]